MASANKTDRRFLDICGLTAEDAATAMSASLNGLTADRAAALLEEFGRNEISRQHKSGFLHEIWSRLKNPLVIQLFIIAAVSFFMGDLRSAVVVCGMVVLSVGLSYIQETRSGNAVEQLRKMVQTTAVALRNGKETELPIAEIVPGDVVLLDAGAIVPADVRLLTSKDFFVNQATLTGESLPVEKNHLPAAAPAPLELANACFQGSNVVSGTAKAIVINTGAKTYLGQLSGRLAGASGQTSFDKGLAGFTWLMIRFMIVMVCATFMLVGISKGNWLQALLFALSVAVGLTPEMLPMIVTVNLSKGALAMAGKKVIVKRLNSIQNFGAIDILCTDKTGTITQDRIILERHVDVTNRPSEDVLRYAYMNSYYQTGMRNLLDRSILSHTELEVEKTCRKVDEIPFDFARKRMSVIIDYEGDHVMICKGAVEDIYKICDRYQVDDEINPLIDIIKNDLLEEYEQLSRNGYRVLAIAYKDFPKTKSTFAVADESGMILLGYLAFFDPPKDSAAQAIGELEKRGVQAKILTGDNALVTRKVCADVGLAAEEVITGDKLVNLDEKTFGDMAEKHRVFARLSPTQKEAIIRVLQKRGHVVGFMGDGINDAPALKAADVGISVDTAVDVAKESADIVLLEKNLLVLEDGIMEGRRVFGNIIKYIRMGASSNFGNMFSVVGASYFLPFLPMAPIQVLLNNLLYDFSQVGIPMDNVDEDYLVSPRKWNLKSIKKFMLFIGPISSIFDYATFFLMLFFFRCINFSNPSFAGMKGYYEQLFHTGWFVESLLTQTIIIYIIRTKRIPFFQSTPSAPMVLTTAAVMLTGIWLPYSPFAGKLGFVPLPGAYWGWIALFILLYACITHKVKTWFFNKYGVN